MRADVSTRSDEPHTAASGSARPGVRLESFSGHLIVLLAAWTLFGLASAANQGHYGVGPLGLVLAGSVLLVVAFVARGSARTTRAVRVIGIGLVATVVLAVSLRFPAGGAAHGDLLVASRCLTVSACVVIVASLLLRTRRPMLTFATTMVLAAAAGITMIRSSPDPGIDVWSMYQAAAHALLHGHNIYTAHWTSGVPGEVTNTYTYLPGSALFLTPFYAIFGDVRYGLLAALLATAVLFVRMSKLEAAPYLGCLLLVYPLIDFGLEESWNDPLILLAVTAAVYAVRQKRLAWAVVSLAAALSFKSYTFLALPLAMRWPDFGVRRTLLALGAAAAVIVPWFVANPSAFWTGSVLTPLRASPRADSLSFVAFLLHHGIDPGLGLTTVALALCLAALLLRPVPGSYGFALGLALSMATFNVASKEPFYNEWMLVSGFCLLAAACCHAPVSPAPNRNSGKTCGNYKLHRVTSRR